MRFLSEKLRPKTRNLATLISRSVFVVIAALTLIVLFQNYQVSSQLISEEIKRTTKQTSSLVQGIVNFKLTSLQIQQDSYSRNDTLVKAIRASLQGEISQFFDSVDETEPDYTPDFRYITINNQLIWDDSSYQFYGMETSALAQLSQDMTLSSNWHITQVPSSLGARYILARKTPIVDSASGEVMATLHIGVVLNNNFGLIEALKRGSNSENVLMLVGSQVIASTLSKKDDYTQLDVINQFAEHDNTSAYLVGETEIRINGVPTYLSVYTVQNNDSILQFKRHHYFGILTLLALMSVVAVTTRYWIQRRVTQELGSLMQYTSDTVERRYIEPFNGSKIEEFDQIGQALELSFKRLTEQEKQFEDLFNFSLSPILVWNREGRVIKMNPAAQKYFNASKVEDPTFHQLVEKLLPQVMMAARGATLTGLNIPLNDKVFRWNLSPIRVEHQTQHILAQGQDITSLILAEQQSETARLEAEESARVRADFLAKMSHELRTPLNGILGVSQLLKRGLNEPEQKEHVDILCNSGEHLLAVLNDILDFSKIEQGKFNIQHTEFRLIETNQAVEKIFSPLCDEKGISLSVQTDFEPDIILNSDQVRLNQILFNLVSNAVKFTHQGFVNVLVSLKTTDKQSQLSVVVEDSGIGISKNKTDTIFEPFVQAESTTTREYGGSGLGLTIVNSLVDLLGGTIDVHSELGRGSRFEVVIPVDVVDCHGSKPNTANDVNPDELFDRQLSVLLVEDNHTNAFIAKAFCEKYGMEVTWVQDGIQSIESVQKHQYDLVLMDNQLPNLGGVEATRIIKEELQSEVPVFACTADGMLDTKREFLAAGADYVLVKPLKEKALFDAFMYLKSHYLSDDLVE
ncbi:quorum-sensing autoinducer 2 sensor kinase/phosphatase LuxQ [Vibrio sp. SCSIO 43135]|uniref:quorum-sensing autoinducer 2 sensor kinase/phosphatase LuxQ n=1 Tax=Vibrio sp. SCSIO 43135 TaxID=2819096 RepID=UPI00336531A8